MQRCGPSGMFLLSACFGMFDFVFDFGMLRGSACLIWHVELLFHTHTHTHFRPGAGLARGREAGFNYAAATLCSNNITDAVSCMQIPSCRSCRFVLVALAQLGVAHTLPARCWSCSWSRGWVQLRCSNAVQQQYYRCCFLHANSILSFLSFCFGRFGPTRRCRL